MLLKDKVCVIAGSGSTRGIGYATAQLFAEHGARLVLLDIKLDDSCVDGLKTTVAQKIDAQPDVSGIQCDITKKQDCERVVVETLSRYGTIDCLINCAGLVRGTPTLSITETEYEQIMNVNLTGAFNLCKSVLPVMSERGSGAIVNLSSSAAQRGGGLVGGAHYAASKAGVIGFTRTIAREFGPNGIRANIVCPSMIETSMLDGMSTERFNEIIQAIPMKRVGYAREVAGACLFLASELGGYVTGATIDVNGGSHIH
jgi:NAD(P)-dependent dehydrogenase (short-subunit alcohol dehydrogenase family)